MHQSLESDENRILNCDGRFIDDSGNCRSGKPWSALALAKRADWVIRPPP